MLFDIITSIGSLFAVGEIVKDAVSSAGARSRAESVGDDVYIGSDGKHHFVKNGKRLTPHELLKFYSGEYKGL